MLQVSETSLFRKELVEPNEKYYVKLPISAVNMKQKAIFLKSEGCMAHKKCRAGEVA